MPLMWTPGYLNRALQLMENVALLPEDVKLCKEAVDVLAAILKPVPVAEPLQEEAKASEEAPKQGQLEDTEKLRLPEYCDQFKDLHAKLQSLGKVDSTSLLTLTTQLVEEKRPGFEEEDLAKYEQKVKEWQQAYTNLVEREKQMREKAQQEREARKAAKTSL
uniref:Uncharacterized protein n=2 Tax=Sphaerodactylus townsendi TaxID=933632 RepID=A0ACB8EQ55_9SAUR